MSQCLVCSLQLAVGGFHTATIELATAQQFRPDAPSASGPICCFAVGGVSPYLYRQSTPQTANRKLQTANRKPLTANPLLVIALGQIACHWCKETEDTTRSPINPSIEVEVIWRPGIGIACTKCDSPKTGNANYITIRVLQLSLKLTGDRVKREDFAATELANQDAMAEGPKVG
jgi:hypothetical protein